MVNLYIIVVYVLLAGLGGFGAGAISLLLFGYTTPEQRWYVLCVSSGAFAVAGFLKALVEIQFFPSLLRILLSLFRRK
ncbi:hypothetical protein DXZ20_10175 [Leptolyngbyaceae cyanobacterium CCMR0081]|uniref:Uncharacterized protein n=1 Tax=Adonisia turfae CCMR0081 TaxID=2292702 RepID=A0A6M0RJQ2_9CYAN|nr:hypothetical protein [Adonisia turfae CCMR0081]